MNGILLQVINFSIKIFITINKFFEKQFIFLNLGKIVNSLTFPDMNIYSVEYSNDGMNYALSLKDHSVMIFI
jgi:hypothetical protein